jgi:hypothetical protein
MKLLAIISTLIVTLAIAQAPATSTAANEDPTQLGEYQEMVEKNIFSNDVICSISKRQSNGCF